MKNIFRYMATALVPACMFSCKIYDDMDNVQEPGYIVAQDTYAAYINDLFKVADLAVFFSRYQEIREDRTAAEKLAGEYFGVDQEWDECLFYESAEIFGRGFIMLEEDGSYTVDTYGDYWSRNSASPDGTYSVTVSDDMKLSIRFDGTEDSSGNAVVSVASVSVGDGWLSLDECRVSCSYSSCSCSIASVPGKPLGRPSLSEPEYVYQASEGSLRYDYSEPDGFADSFIVVFHDDSVTIEREGETVRCLPFGEGANRQSDYIIM